MKNSDIDEAKLKKYQNDHISFTLGDEIGSGGNGKVYNVNIVEGKQWLKDNWSEIDVEHLVVKVFSVDKKDKNIREERYKRFCNEIETLKKIGTSIRGIIPIIDFYCCKNCPQDDDEAWFIMPMARPKRINKEEKLEFLIYR